MADAPTRRILLVGGSGMLGRALRRTLDRRLPEHEVWAPPSAELDLGDPSSVAPAVKSFAPEWIFNAAAYTRVDDAETESDLARRINGDGPGHLADAALAADAYLLHVSTDYVFDGAKVGAYSEDDPTAPLGAYGRSKLEGERAVRRSGARAAIVRTAWLYGPHGANFVDTIRRALRSRPRLTVVQDQHGSPTYARDLADALVSLAQAGGTGVVHITGSGVCSWFEFACEIARLEGSEVPIEPVGSEAYPRPAPRPTNSMLDCSRYETITGRRMREWPAALAEYVAEFPSVS